MNRIATIHSEQCVFPAPVATARRSPSPSPQALPVELPLHARRHEPTASHPPPVVDDFHADFQGHLRGQLSRPCGAARVCFFLALFPALLFLLALASLFPFQLIQDLMSSLALVAPPEVLSIIRDQLTKIAVGDDQGILTIGILGAVWSSSAALGGDHRRAEQRIRRRGMTAVVEGPADRDRPDRGARRLHSRVVRRLVLAGPTVAEWLGRHAGYGAAFEWTWKILQWPIAFLLRPPASRSCTTSRRTPSRNGGGTPGALFGTILWLFARSASSSTWRTSPTTTRPTARSAA